MKKSKRVVTILAAFILVLGVSKIIYAESGSSRNQEKNKRYSAKKNLYETLPVRAQFASAYMVDNQKNSGETSVSVSKLVTSIPYGDGDEQVGLKWTGLPDNSAVGPDNFAIGKSAIYINDLVNKRLQVYGLNGEHLRTIDISADNFAVDDDGYIFATVGEHVHSFSPEGKLVAKVSKEDDDGVINEINGNVVYSYNEVDGSTEEVGTVSNGIITKVTDNQEKKRIGKVTRSGNSWKISKKSKDTALVHVFDRNNKNLKTFEYTSNGLLDFVFVDEGPNGNLFIDMGRQVSSNKAVGETLVLNSQGEEIKRISQEMPICWVGKNIEVTSDGSVWQVVPVKAGLNIYRWEN